MYACPVPIFVQGADCVQDHVTDLGLLRDCLALKHRSGIKLRTLDGVDHFRLLQDLLGHHRFHG